LRALDDFTTLAVFKTFTALAAFAAFITPHKHRADLLEKLGVTDAMEELDKIMAQKIKKIEQHRSAKK